MISIVVPAHNEEQDLASCLEALQCQSTTQELEIIVVDNASTDSTPKILARLAKQDKRIKVLREPKLGIGAARATGFSAARGGIVLSTDADTQVPAGWAEGHAALLQEPGVAAITGTCKINDNSRFKNTVFNLSQPAAMVAYRILVGHFWLTGSNFAIKKDVYAKAGGFKRDIAFEEDIDLGFRVCKQGRIRLTTKLPVLTSSRRFQKGFIRGWVTYISWFIRIFILKSS